MSASVTVSRACAACGAPLEGRRQQTRTCSDRCRQRWSRARRAQTPKRVELSAELRSYLRAEVDRRRREQIERQLEADRLLFRDEVAA